MGVLAASPDAPDNTTMKFDMKPLPGLMHQSCLMYIRAMKPAIATDLGLTVQRMKALGDEKRLRILLRLTEGERCVCDLTDDLGAGQSLLSFHLRALKDAGLVTDRREGRWVHYSLSAAGLVELEEFLRGLRESAAAAGAAGSSCCD
jgi:ArsR family transcriptional regulator, arsenate/arsenite/antimonite-responsive transcriptional repressor